MLFPIPDLAIQKALDSGDPLDSPFPGGRTWRTYQGLWRCEKRRLEARIAKLPESPLRSQLQQQLLIADDLVGRSTGKLSANLLKAADTISKIDGELDTPRPVRANLYLQAAIGMLDRLVGQPAGNGDRKVLDLFHRLFGDGTDTAVARFLAIVAGLKAIDQRTDGAKQGFVHDRALPTEMAAVAHDHGVAATISVGDAALNGSLDLTTLASLLAHEGSHALPQDVATIDIVYRSGTAHYLLEPNFAVLNAASFEQVVLDVLGTPTPNSDLVAARSRPRLGKARLVLASRITRTWLRAWDFSRGVQLPAGIEKYLQDLPPSEFGSLTSAYMTRLYQRMKDLMEGVYRLEHDAHEDTADPVEVAVERLLVQMLEGSPLSVPYYVGHLQQLIMEIERFDRPDYAVLMAKFYSSFL